MTINKRWRSSISNPADHASEEVHKLLYATGLADQLLAESLEAFEKALELVASLEVPVYRTIVAHRIEKNKRMKAEIQGYLASIS